MQTVLRSKCHFRIIYGFSVLLLFSLWLISHSLLGDPNIWCEFNSVAINPFFRLRPSLLFLSFSSLFRPTFPKVRGQWIFENYSLIQQLHTVSDHYFLPAILTMLCKKLLFGILQWCNLLVDPSLLHIWNCSSYFYAWFQFPAEN